MTISGSMFKNPDLIELPPTHFQMFCEYLDKKCEKCSKDVANVSKSICLLCGKYITNCCGNTNMNHIKECGLDIGLYFYIYTVCVHIYTIKNNSYTKWGSLYLDAYGEENGYFGYCYLNAF